MLRKTLASMFGTPRKAARPAPRRALVSMMALEDRTVPSSVLLDSANGSGYAVYNQNFNTLANAAEGQSYGFASDSPLPVKVDPAYPAKGTIQDGKYGGWYSAFGETNQEPGFYIVEDGTDNQGALYSFGVSGNADRALGSIGSNSVANIHNAVRFTNNDATLDKITKLAVSFDLEKWREANTATQSLRTYWSTNAEALYGPDAFDFTLENTTNSPSGSSVAVSFTIDLTTAGEELAAGKSIWLRFTDRNDDGNDDGLGIDNLVVTPTFVSGAATYSLEAKSTPTTGTALYSQNFNTGLATAGAFNAYSTIDAGFTVLGQKQASTPDSFTLDTGTNNAGGLYSYGASGGSDRALGSIGSDNAVAGGFEHILRVRNAQSADIDRVNVAYNGEQYRYGGNLNDPQRLQFQYSLSDGHFWVDVPSLDFVSPIQSGTTGAVTATKALSANLGGIDGENTDGQQLNWKPGTDILFRWIDINDAGNDNALAIDDIVITTSTGTTAGADFLNPVSLTGTGSGNSKSQNFNTLATDNPNNTWTPGGTLPGWFAQAGNTGATVLSYRGNDGADFTGAVYSFGSDPSDSDRALGSIGSNNNEAGYFAYGAAYTNSTGGTVTDVTVSFNLEQWRRADDITTDRLVFQVSDDGGATWQTDTALVTDGPQAAAYATGLNGNLASNRDVVLNVTFNAALDIANGETFLVRWVDVNDVGNDHGFGIDDFSIFVA